MSLPSLQGELPEGIAARLGLEKTYRGLQIFEGLHRLGKDFAGMTSLPEELRSRLQRDYSPFTTRPGTSLSDPDGTVKLRVDLADGAAVECVLLTDQSGRRTACLSTQAGCAMGCAFCRTGLLGFHRNLDAAEIVEQYHHLDRAHGPIGNIVYMGMGEPLMNLENLRRSIEIFIHPRGMALSLRKMTVSTCGVAPGIVELADRGPPVGIAVSLITADEETRKKIMPVTRRWGLAELREAMAYHQKKTGKRLTLEIVLLKGLNDRPADVRRLLDFVRGLDVIVNLIPWNSVSELDFREPDEETVQMYRRELESARIPSTRRYRRGRKIGGACGQLGVVV